MGMAINHNVSAINTLRTLNGSNRMLSKSLQRLSSGYRINVGADGPADLVISEQLRAQTVGLERAVRNTQEAMNVIGIAEGALNEMNEILKTMRALALHASNSGITSPIQVAADQAEVDSSIQTIDRIATTTKYSDQFLLNGAKQLGFERRTDMDRSTDYEMMDIGASKINQVFKTKGYSVGITFSGATDAGETTADVTVEARRAMFETNYLAGLGSEIDGTTRTTLSNDQRFIVNGSKGSRGFSFGMGAHLGDVAAGINNLADSTGVGAQLIFDAAVTGSAQNTDTGGAVIGAGNTRAAGEIEAYHLNSDFQQKTATNAYSHDVGVTINAAGGGVYDVQAGKDTDGAGRIYLKWTNATDFEVYKDKDFEMYIGTGTDGGNISFVKDVDFNTAGGPGSINLQVDLNAGAAATGDVTVLQLGAATELDTVDSTDPVNLDNMDGLFLANVAGGVGNGADVISGVDLGYNTDSQGKLYFKLDATNIANATVTIFKDSAMTNDSIVSQATGVDLTAAATAHTFATNLNGGSGPNSGLYATLGFNAMAVGTDEGVYAGDLFHTDLGLRLFSTEYGSDESITVDAKEGALFGYYEDPSSNNITILDAGSNGQSYTDYGNNASVTINGLELEFNGLEGSISTQDINASLVFDGGSLGQATVAQTGHDSGSIYSRSGDINDSSNYATNAIRNTTETLEKFTGGMQFQLGEGQGDQERTVYSIESMAVANMGRVEFYDDFEGQGLYETKVLTMEDVLGGGLASLSVDPVKSLTIIDKAIADVSSLRARLGATQKNLLQTNQNNLEVAVENITATESAIRDANMAAESTDFTKNQILVQAGTAMLAQANVTSQNVLQLLG